MLFPWRLKKKEKDKEWRLWSSLLFFHQTLSLFTQSTNVRQLLLSDGRKHPISSSPVSKSDLSSSNKMKMLWFDQLQSEAGKQKGKLPKSGMLYENLRFCLVMLGLFFLTSSSRRTSWWKIKWTKRCFVLLWNCASRPFLLAFSAWRWQCGK